MDESESANLRQHEKSRKNFSNFMAAAGAGGAAAGGAVSSPGGCAGRPGCRSLARSPGAVFAGSTLPAPEARSRDNRIIPRR